MLTIDSIKARVRAIRNASHDYEVAHSLEDELYYDLLVDIGNRLPPEHLFHQLIKEAVKAHKIPFARYTA